MGEGDGGDPAVEKLGDEFWEKGEKWGRSERGDVGGGQGRDPGVGRGGEGTGCGRHRGDMGESGKCLQWKGLFWELATDHPRRAAGSELIEASCISSLQDEVTSPRQLFLSITTHPP
ncbi:unnamed protein product [Boreogadus saida]